MRKTYLLATFLAISAGAALAQDAAPAAAKPDVRSPRIAVLDMARVSAETLLGKGYASQLDVLKNEIDAEGTKKQNELQKTDAAIKALQDELEKQGSVLSPDAADKKRQEIVRKTRDRQAFLEDGQQELQRMRDRAQQQAQSLENDFQVKVKPHIDAVVKEKGIDLLLDSRVILAVSKDYDISREVIVKADDAERAAKAKAPAASGPKAPEKPAAAPSKP
jgi:Skp family chaperone for outer membrane proteins